MGKTILRIEKYRNSVITKDIGGEVKLIMQDETRGKYNIRNYFRKME